MLQLWQKSGTFADVGGGNLPGRVGHSFKKKFFVCGVKIFSPANIFMLKNAAK